MKSSAPIVALDACVLYPAALRSLMMWLAVHDAIRPRWTDEIHAEWIRNVLANRQDLQPEQLERTRVLMDSHVEDCLVTGYKNLIPTLVLPDPNDRHVLAAAIVAEADAIITWNLRDFPKSSLTEFGIGILTPDQLVRDLLRENRDLVIRAMKEHQSSLRNPPRTTADYLDNLAAQGLIESIRTLDQMSLRW